MSDEPTYPESIQNLVTHEVYLDLARQELAHSREGLVRQRKELTRTRPPFGVLGGRDARDSYAGREQDLRETIAGVDEAIARIDRLLPPLRRRILDEFEEFLRRGSPAYREGMASRQFLADWERNVWLLEQKLGVVRATIGSARNTCCTGFDRLTRKRSAAAEDALRAAVQAAHDLERDIEFINELGNVHARHAAHSAAASATLLPELPHLPYAAWIGGIGDLEMAHGLQEFDRVLAALDELQRDGVPALRAAVETTRSTTESSMQGYLESCWKDLQDHAREHWVDRDRVIEGVDRAERDLGL